MAAPPHETNHCAEIAAKKVVIISRRQAMTAGGLATLFTAALATYEHHDTIGKFMGCVAEFPKWEADREQDIAEIKGLLRALGDRVSTIEGATKNVSRRVTRLARAADAAKPITADAPDELRKR